LSAESQGVQSSQGRYLLIPRTLAFVRNDEDVLFLKGAPDKRLYPNKYNGIGGHVEVGESIPASALREIGEEVGILDIENLKLRAIISIDTNTNPGILLFVFTAHTKTRSLAGSLEGMPEWINTYRLPENELAEDLPIILPRILAMGDLEPPIFIHYTYDVDGKLSIRFGEEKLG